MDRVSVSERLLSGVLALLMVFACVTVDARADEIADAEEASETYVITGKGDYEYDIVCDNPEAVVTDTGTLQLSLVSKEGEEQITKGILWKISKSSIASIDNKGLVKGKTIGAVEVLCLSLDGLTTYATADIKVVKGVTGVTLDSKSATLLTGIPGTNDSITIKAEVSPKDAYYKDVTWISEDPTVATVDIDGKVSAVAPGKTKITAVSNDPSYDKELVCDVEVCQAVTSVVLSLESATVYTSESVEITAEAFPEDAANKNIEWISSNPDVATVDAKGKIKGISVGSAIITGAATDGSGTKAECSVDVIAKVKDLKLDKDSLTLFLGLGEDEQQATIGYAIAPEDAFCKSVTWSSSDESIASVDENGNIYGYAEGTAVITAVSDDESYTKPASCKVTIQQAVTGIELSTQQETLYTGTSVKVTADVYPENAANKKYTWESSDKSIATVDSNGNVKAVAVGSAVISCVAADGSGTYAECKIDSIAKVKGLKLSEDKATLLIGAGDKLRMDLDYETTPADAFCQTVTWSSSDEDVAVVDENGVVSGTGEGNAVISAISDDPDYQTPATCKITVSQAVMDITISGEKESIYNGDALKLTAEVSPENAANKKIEWTSSNPDIATVDSNGNVKGKTAGKVTITCSALDGSEVSQSYSLTVNAKVTGLTISESKFNLLIGSKKAQNSKKLTCTISPDNAHVKTVTWSSSDESIAKVGKDGTVKAVAPGTAVITAVSNDSSYTGKATCSVTVGYAVKEISIKADGYSGDTITMNKGSTIKAKAYTEPEKPLINKLEWSSTDESVARVDSNGNITAVGAGCAYIICSATDGSSVKNEIVIEVVQPVIPTPNATVPVKTSSYIANTNTKKFHYPSCSSVNQMSEKNKWYYTGTRDDLIAQGYKPCGKCHP